VTYYLQKTEVVVDLYEYEQNLCERRKTMKTETVYRKVHEEGRDTIYFDTDGNEVSKRKYETLTGGSVVTYSDVSVDMYNALTPEEQADYTETQKNVYYRVDIVESPVELEEGAYDETEVSSKNSWMSSMKTDKSYGKRLPIRYPCTPSWTTAATRRRLSRRSWSKVPSDAVTRT
jgi:hypothetical protein